MPTIIIRPDRAALCWTATWGDRGALPAGTYPLPFTLDAALPYVAAQLRAQFPDHRVTGVQAACAGCGE